MAMATVSPEPSACPQKGGHRVGRLKTHGKTFAKRAAISIEKFMDQNYVQVVLSAMLFISLFLPDIWVLANPPNSDDVILNTVRERHRGAV